MKFWQISKSKCYKTHEIIFWQNSTTQILTTQQNKLWHISKIQNVTKFQKVKLWPNSKTENVTNQKLKLWQNPNYEKTKKIVLWQRHKNLTSHQVEWSFRLCILFMWSLFLCHFLKKEVKCSEWKLVSWPWKLDIWIPLVVVQHLFENEIRTQRNNNNLKEISLLKKSWVRHNKN